MKLCPQEYDGMDMRVVPCDRCSVGWDASRRRCTVPTGAEHFPLVPAAEVPVCPIQDRCQHQVQQVEPCIIRARGMICESALTMAGVVDAHNHPLAFNDLAAMTPEELATEEEDPCT